MGISQDRQTKQFVDAAREALSWYGQTFADLGMELLNASDTLESRIARYERKLAQNRAAHARRKLATEKAAAAEKRQRQRQAREVGEAKRRLTAAAKPVQRPAAKRRA